VFFFQVTVLYISVWKSFLSPHRWCNG